LIALLFALDRTIFYSVPFKVPALNRVTGGGPYTLVRRDIVFKPSWSIDLSTVRTGFGVVGEKVDTLVTDGHWYVNPHSRLSMQSLKSYTRFHIWFHINSDTFGIHQFGRRLSTTTILLVIRPSSPVTSDTWLPVWSFYIPISAEASTTSRYLLSVVSMNLNENVDV
jgi:hypothetical protein